VEQRARQLQGRCRGRAERRVSARICIVSVESVTLDISVLELEGERCCDCDGAVECLVFVCSNCVNAKLTRQALYTMLAVSYSAQIPADPADETRGDEFAFVRLTNGPQSAAVICHVIAIRCISYSFRDLRLILVGCSR